MFPNREGQNVPSATFKTLENGVLRSITSDEVFAGRTVIVFSLPGAFTPTCSSSHLPRFEQLADLFQANGVDEIVCVSVNDAFVMEAWARDQGASRVKLLADGNGEFTRGMGMLVDKSDLGFGQRSWRYSMLVKDGVIAKENIEPEREGDPFEVSDADTMLRFVSPSATLPKVAALFTRPGCPHCARAKAALASAGWKYEEIVLGRDASRQALRTITGGDTVPQVFVDGQRIGTADDLERFLASSERQAAVA